MKWRRIAQIVTVAFAIVLFVANIPQSAALNGEGIVQNEVARVARQVNQLNAFFVQEGYTPSQFVAVADYTDASLYDWHVRLERHTPIRRFTLITTDVWSDAAGNQHGQHRGEWVTTENATLVLGRLDPDGKTIRWVDPAYSGGYSTEPLWYFKDRLHADAANRRDQTGSALDQPLDGVARRCLRLLESSATSPGQQACFLDALNAYFRRLHRTAYDWHIRGLRPGVFVLEGYRRYPYHCSEPLQLALGATMNFIGMPDGKYHPWEDFLSGLCREEGVGLFDPDLRVAVVTNGVPDDSRIADMLQEAAAQGDIYATVDVFDPTSYRTLFGFLGGYVNDPWIVQHNWQLPTFPEPGDFAINTPRINDYHLVWVASAPDRSNYELGRWEQMVLSNWLRTVGGTLVVGGRRTGGLETWTAHQSSYTQFTSVDWFESGVGDWVNEVGDSCWHLESTTAGYVGKALRVHWAAPAPSASFSVADEFPNTPIHLGANPQLHFWINSSLNVTVRANILWLDAVALLWMPLVDMLDVVSLQLNATNGKWAEVAWDLNQAATLLHGTEWGSPDQLLALDFCYSGGSPNSNDYFLVDEVCTRTGKAVTTEPFLDVRSRQFGFGESFSTDNSEVVTWESVAGENGYSHWQTDFTDGQAVFHVWAAAPPTPGMAPGPYPTTTTSRWWESDRGPTWIEYVNTTNPVQKRRTTGLDLTNVGTLEEPRWVTDDEYPPTLLIELKNHTLLPFSNPAVFFALLVSVGSEVFAVGVQTTRATAGFPLDTMTPYSVGQLLYGPRLSDRTLPSLSTAMFHIMPRIHALAGDSWSVVSLAQVNRQHWLTTGTDPRKSVAARVNAEEGWTEISYTTDHAAMLSGVWSYTLTLRVYRDSPHPHLKLQLTSHSYSLQNLAVSFDLTATGWRTGYDLSELAVRATATAAEDRYPLSLVQDVAARYPTLDPLLRLLCQNQESFVFDFADMKASGFSRPQLQVLDVQLPWGGTRRVLQAGMGEFGSVAQDTRIAIDPTLIAYGTTHTDDVYASKDSAGTYEGAADTATLRLGVDEHQGVPSDWYNGAWGYRKSHVLSSSASQTNYQVKVIVKRQTGTDSGGTVYVETKCRTDFGDLRFTKADGVTLLDHWLESSDGTTATFWVEVPQLVVGSTTVYVYYGNPSASGASNGDATFLFFDGFTTWNANKWSVTEYTGGTRSREVTQGGELHVYASSSADPAGYYFRTTGSWSEANVAIYAKTRWANLDDHRGAGEFLGVQLIDGGGQATGETVSLYGDYRTYLYRWRDGTTNGLDPDGMVQGPTAGNAYFTFTKVGSSWSISLSGTFSHTWSGSITTVTTPCRLQLDAYLDYWTGTVQADSYFDYLYMRKYASSEPTHGTWGSEQTLPMLKRANRLLTSFNIASIPHSPLQRIDSAFLVYPIYSDGGTHSHTVWATRTTNATWDSATNAARWSWATTGTSVSASVGGYGLSFNVTSHVQTLYDANATYAAWKLWLDNDAAFSYLDWYLVGSNNGNGDPYGHLEITYSEKPLAPTVANTAILGMEDDGGWGGPNWLDLGWQYRKSHTMTGSTGGALTDYQMRVVVRYGYPPPPLPGGESGDTMYCSERCQADFDDLRFTAADGVTPLPHWRESYVVGSSAVFWVKLPSLPAAPDPTTFYVYYGNGAAVSASNIGTTMLFGDDFTGTSLDQGKWTPYEYTGGYHYYQVSSTGELRVHAESWDTVTSGYYFASVPTWSATNLAVTVKGRWANLDYVRGGGDFLGVRVRDAAADETGYSLGLRGDYKVNLWRYPDYPTNSLYEWNPADYAAGNATITLTKLGTAWTLNLAGTYTDTWSGSLTVSGPYSLRLSSSLQYWTEGVQGDTYFDYVYVRNYAAAEPSHGGWGVQEGGGTGAVDNCYATHTYSVQTRVTDPNKWQDIQWVNVSIGSDVRLTYHYYCAPNQGWVQELSPSGTVVNTSATTLQITWAFTPGWGTSLIDVSVTSQAKDYASLVGQEVLPGYVDLIRELRLDGYTAADTHVNPSQAVSFSGQLHYQAAGGVPNRWYAGSVQVGYYAGGQFIPIGTSTAPNGVFTVPAIAPTPVNRYAVYPLVDGAVGFSGQAVDVVVDRLLVEATQVTDPDWWVNSGTTFQWVFKCKYEYNGTYVANWRLNWNGQVFAASGDQVTMQATGYDVALSFVGTAVADGLNDITTAGNTVSYQVRYTRVLAVVRPSEQSLNWSVVVYLMVTAWWAHDGSPYTGQLTLYCNGTSLGTQDFVDGWSRWTKAGFAANTTCIFNATAPVNALGITVLSTNGTWCSWRPDCLNDEDYDGLPDAWEVQYGYAFYPVTPFYLNALNATDWVSDYDGDGIPAYVEYELGTSPVSAAAPGLIIGECYSEVFTAFDVAAFPFLEFRVSSTPNALVKVTLYLSGNAVWNSGWLNATGLQTFRFTPTCTWVDRVGVAVRSVDGVNATVWLDWLQIYHPSLLPRPLEWIGQVHQNPSLVFVSDIGGLKGTVPNVLPSGLVNTPAEYGIDVGATLPGWWVEQMGWGGLMPGAVFRDYLTGLSDLMWYVSRVTRSEVYQWEGGWSPVEEEQFAPSNGTTTAVYHESSLLLNLSVDGKSIGCWVGDDWNASMPLHLTTSLGILDPVNTSWPVMGYALSWSKLDAHSVRARLDWTNNGSLSYASDAFRGAFVFVQAEVSDVVSVGVNPEDIAATSSTVTFVDECLLDMSSAIEFTVQFAGGYADNTWTGAALPWAITPVGFTSPWGGGVSYLTTYLYCPQPQTLDNTTIISCSNDFSGVYATSHLAETVKNASWTTRAWLNGIELNRTIRRVDASHYWPGYQYETPRFSLPSTGLTLRAGFNQLVLRFDVPISDELLIAQATATDSLANTWTVQELMLYNGWGVDPFPSSVYLRCQGNNPYVTYPDYALANVAVEHGQILFYGYLDAADTAPWTLAEREGLYGLKADGFAVRSGPSDPSCAGKAFLQNLVEEVAKQFDALFLAGRHYAGALVGTGIQPTGATAQQAEELCTQMFQTGIELRSNGDNIALLNEWATQFNTLMTMWGSQPEWGGLEIIVPGDIGTSTVWFEATTRDPWVTGRLVDGQGWLIDGEGHHYVAVWARYLPPWYSTWSDVWYRVYSDLRVVREEGEVAHPSGWYDLFDNVADGTAPDPPMEQEPEHPLHNPFFNHESSSLNFVSMGHLTNETGLRWQMWHTNGSSFGDVFGRVFGLFDLLTGIVKDIWINPIIDTITCDGLTEIQRLMYLLSLRELNGTDFGNPETPIDQGTVLEPIRSGYWQGFLSFVTASEYVLSQAGILDLAVRFMERMVVVRGTPLVMRFDVDVDMPGLVRLASVAERTMSLTDFIEWAREHDSNPENLKKKVGDEWVIDYGKRWLDWGVEEGNPMSCARLADTQNRVFPAGIGLDGNGNPCEVEQLGLLGLRSPNGKSVPRPMGAWDKTITPARSTLRAVMNDAHFSGKACYHEVHTYCPGKDGNPGFWFFDLKVSGSNGATETALLAQEISPELQPYLDFDGDGSPDNKFETENLGIEYRQSVVVAVVPGPGGSSKALAPVVNIIIHNSGQRNSPASMARLRWAMIGDLKVHDADGNSRASFLAGIATGEPQGFCITHTQDPSIPDGQVELTDSEGASIGIRICLSTGDITAFRTQDGRFIPVTHRADPQQDFVVYDDMDPAESDSEQVSTTQGIPNALDGRTTVLTIAPSVDQMEQAVESMTSQVMSEVAEIEAALQAAPVGTLTAEQVGYLYERARYLFGRMREKVASVHLFHDLTALRREGGDPAVVGVNGRVVASSLKGTYTGANEKGLSFVRFQTELRQGWIAAEGNPAKQLELIVGKLATADLAFRKALGYEVAQLKAQIKTVKERGVDVHQIARTVLAKALRQQRDDGRLFDRDQMWRNTLVTGECMGHTGDDLNYLWFLFSLYDPKMDSEVMREHNAAYFNGARGVADIANGPQPSQLYDMLDILASSMRELFVRPTAFGVLGDFFDQALQDAGIEATDPRAPGVLQMAFDSLGAALESVEMAQRALVLTGGQCIVAQADTGEAVTLADYLWATELKREDGSPLTIDGVQVQGLGLGHFIQQITEDGNALTRSGIARFFDRESHDEQTTPEALRKSSFQAKVDYRRLYGWITGIYTPQSISARAKVDALRFDMPGMPANKATLFERVLALLNIGKTTEAVRRGSLMRIEDTDQHTGQEVRAWGPREDPAWDDCYALTPNPNVNRYLRRLDPSNGLELPDINVAHDGFNFRLERRAIHVSTITDNSESVVQALTNTIWRKFGLDEFELGQEKVNYLKTILASIGPEFSNLMSFKAAAQGKQKNKPQMHASLQEQITFRMYLYACNALMGRDFLTHCQYQLVYAESHDKNKPENNPVSRKVAKLVGCIGIAAGIFLAATSFMGFHLPKHFGETSMTKAAGYKVAGGGIAVGLNTLGQLKGGLRENTFAFQLIWGPLGTALGAALATKALNDGWFDPYFDPLDGAEWDGTKWAWIATPGTPGTLWQGSQPAGCAMPQLGTSPYINEEQARNFELNTQLLASWTWAWLLSFLTWFTDYIELACVDFTMELVNCVVGGLQATCAGVFQQALLEVATPNGLERNQQSSHWWHHDQWIQKGEWWSYESVLPTEALVPTFCIQFESVFTILRHVLSYPTWGEVQHDANIQSSPLWISKGLHYDADLGYWTPPREENLGALLCGLGRHEWDDGTVGAAIWDGYYQVVMWSLGALVSAGFLLGGGSFTSALAGVLGSLVANQIAAFVIQWVMQMTTEFVIWNIIVSIPFVGADPTPSGQDLSGNTRYKSWARQ